MTSKQIFNCLIQGEFPWIRLSAKFQVWTAQKFNLTDRESLAYLWKGQNRINEMENGDYYFQKAAKKLEGKLPNVLTFIPGSKVILGDHSEAEIDSF